MDRILLDRVIFTDYGQFDIGWGEDYPGFAGDFTEHFTGQVNGLVGASHPGGVYLHFGRRSGGSAVQIVLLGGDPGQPGERTGHDGGAPGPADIVGAADIVEVSFILPPGRSVRWSTWAGETSGTLEDLPAGPYRLRATERGRDAGHAGEFAPEVVDSYLFQLWPAPVCPDRILQVGSINARYWHRELGTPR